MTSSYRPISHVSDMSDDDHQATVLGDDRLEHNALTQNSHNATSPLSLTMNDKKVVHATTRSMAVDGRSVTVPQRRRRHFLAPIVVLIYLAFLIVPWILTCILTQRPLNSPSYFDQSLGLPSDSAYRVKFWIGFINTANAVAFLMTIPVISAILARGAVVYFESKALNSRITLHQTFALADRAWLEPALLWKALSSRSVRTLYLLPAWLLVIIAVVQVPLRIALVTTDVIIVPTCLDSPATYFPSYDSCPGRERRDILAYDAEPHALAVVPQLNVVNELMKRLATTNLVDIQPYLWTANADSGPYSIIESRRASNVLGSVLGSDVPGNGTRFWASTVPSSLQCHGINRSDFPDTCAGGLPFTLNYTDGAAVSARVCVPGNLTHVPWSLSRDSQLVTEEMFVDAMIERVLPLPNFTVKCTAYTTRQYFELPNDFNNHTASDFLDKWPSESDMAQYFNDKTDIVGNEDLVEQDNSTSYSTFPYTTDNYDFYGKLLPGPLTTTALALFGNGSFFGQLASSTGTNVNATQEALELCRANSVPFSNLQDPMQFSVESLIDSSCKVLRRNRADGSETATMLATFLSAFSMNQTDFANTTVALNTALYLANEITLRQAVDGQSLYNRRPIFVSDGTAMSKPSMDRSTMIGISVLTGLQALALILLLAYIYHKPTWTATLDALAVCRLGQSAPPAAALFPSSARNRWQHDVKVHQAKDGAIMLSPLEMPSLRRAA